MLSLGAALALALASASSGSRVSAGAPQQAPDVNGIAPEGLAQIEALIREKETRSPAEQKIDSQLLYARRMQQGLPVAPGVQTLEVELPYADDGHVIVDVKTNGANVTTGLMAHLGSLTSELVKTSPRDLQLHVDLDQVEALAARPDVLYVQPRAAAFTSRSGPPRAGRLKPAALRRAAVGEAVRKALMSDPYTNLVGSGRGSTTSQADVTHRSAVFRGLTGFNGSGVKIGVLSDGVEHLADAQASGDLGPVTVLPGQTGSGDEGTAMLELIHDMAPGAQLYFATAFTSITSFADNIRALRTAGCDIIVDDVGYFVESPFQDGQDPAVISPTNAGVVTQAVKDVAASGAMYFSSAGNSGNLNDGTSGVWEGDFSDGGATAAPLAAGRLHNFAAAQPFNTLTVAGSGPINLFWSDPLGASGNDYDLFRLNAAGTAVAASSTNVQNGNDDPYEQISNSTANPRIVVVKANAAAARFLHLNTNRGELATATAGQTHGHSATSNLFTFSVAAAYVGFAHPNPFSTANVIETFSSDGPRRVFFLADGTAVTPGNFSSTGGAVLQKPDLTAGDGAFVTGAGDFPGQFFGTSAAAPHAAAIMALIKSANPGFTQSQLRSALFATALDIEAPGVDRDSGIGIVMAAAPQPGCTFTLAPPSVFAVHSGGSGTATVTASSGSCNWAAWSNVAWITIPGTGVGVGSGPLPYTVAANPGPARSGTITIQGGQTLTVDQAGSAATTFANVTPLPIADSTTQESSLAVSGLTGSIRNVTVSFHLTHTFDADLRISLVAPDLTTIDLSVENGGSANNYGSACSPLTSRTTFDDSASPLITQGSAPFTGRTRPEQPLATFNGKAGAAANGTWKLRIADGFAGDTGTLLCWSLNFNTGSATQADFNGDGAADIAVYRPSTGQWFIRNQGGVQFGDPSDIPVAGDYNGDGLEDIAVFRPATSQWFVRNQFTVPFGDKGDVPVPGDFDGDGDTDVAVYRPSTGDWFVRNQFAVNFGGPGHVPIVGDYNGDGTDDVAVFQTSTGMWFVRNQLAVQFGDPGDRPVPGDYNGNGATDIAVYRPSTGQWFVRNQFAVQFGDPGDLPVPRDYDGDGDIDVAIYRPSTHQWFVKDQLAVSFGDGRDKPVPLTAGITLALAGDYDGDGSADIAVHRPTTNQWFVRNQLAVSFGDPGDIPIPADYNFDRRMDIAVYRPSTGHWFVRNQPTVQWGDPSDKPVPGDYNGDGLMDVAVFRPSTGFWFVRNQFSVQFSVDSADVPVPGDYNGDGTTDLAVYRPSNGQWFVRNVLAVQFGDPGDIPVPADYNGDGRMDVAVYRPSTRTWFVRNQFSVQFGDSGDVAVPADYNGDGITDIAVYRPSTGQWFVRNVLAVSFGDSTHVPMVRIGGPR